MHFLPVHLAWVCPIEVDAVCTSVVVSSIRVIETVHDLVTGLESSLASDMVAFSVIPLSFFQIYSELIDPWLHAL